MNTGLEQGQQKESVYYYIRRAVMTHAFSPGQILGIDGIAGEIMADAASVQEAVNMLTLENWVTPVAEGGVRICPVTRREVEEVMEMRQVLEPLILERAMPRLGGRQFAYLDALVVQHERLAAVHGAEEQFLNADKSFHLYLTGFAGNLRLTGFMRTALDLHLRLGVRYVRAQAHIASCLREHGAIVNALRRADCPAAKDALHRHLDRARDDLLAYLEGKWAGA